MGQASDFQGALMTTRKESKLKMFHLKKLLHTFFELVIFSNLESNLLR